MPAKVLGLILFLAFTASVATASERPAAPGLQAHASCELITVAYDWDFAVSDQGFTTSACANEAWAWGATAVPGAPGTVWGAALTGDYPSNAGDALISPPFVVTAAASRLEILHHVAVEPDYDGGNVSVGGVALVPISGYPSNLAPLCAGASGAYSTYIDDSWMTECFDLGPYLGQQIQLQFNFDSDGSWEFSGWHIAYAKVGSSDPVPAESDSWGLLKAQYR